MHKQAVKTIFAVSLSTLLFLSACNQNKQSDAKAVDKSLIAHYPKDHKLSSKERKQYSEQFLKQHNVPVLASLPLVDDYTNAKFRDKEEVAKKAVVLYGLIAVANQAKTSEEMITYFKKYDLWNSVSPEEQKYLYKSAKTQDDHNPVTWRIENLNVLFWALGHFNDLPFPTSMCDFKDYKNLPDLGADPTGWIAKSKLRNTEDILNQTDLIYRIHWATTEARLKDTPMPAGINNDIVMERHFALNWLTMYDDNWDDITTDT